MKMMLSVVTVLMVAGSANAQSVQEKKVRARVNEHMAKATADAKTGCGHDIKFDYDWAAFDKLDFAKLGKKKEEMLSSESSNTAEIGAGLAKLCADKDYKDALGKITSVQYVPVLDDKVTVKASVSGSTMKFDNYINGSTRSAKAYAEAAKKAL